MLAVFAYPFINSVGCAEVPVKFVTYRDGFGLKPLLDEEGGGVVTFGGDVEYDGVHAH